MKLNPDCIRDVLLCLEELVNGHSQYIFDNYQQLSNEFPVLSKYSIDTIEYSVNQCNQIGFLFHCKINIEGFSIVDITPMAHEFLANIRTDTIWSKTKTIAEKIGAASLNAFVQIASNVLTEIIKAELHL